MTGIDLEINSINTLLTAKLWLSNNNAFYGRVWENDHGQGVIPEIVSGDKYFEVLHNDRYDAQLFWRVMPTNKRGTGLYNVQLYVYVNLKKVYPALENRDAYEEAIYDIINVLRYANFRYENTVTGKEAFSYWKGSSQNKHDMNPYGMFRMDGIIHVYSMCLT